MDAAKPFRKPKVVFVLGAMGTGRSKLAIALAAHFNGEVINSNKMCVRPDEDFTDDDFCREAIRTVSRVLAHGRLPIIAGGPNRYLEALLERDGGAFRASHDCLFIWVDVGTEPVLRGYASMRVDDMVRRGFVAEAPAAFVAGADDTGGVRRATTGFPELDHYLRAEREAAVDEGALAEMLKSALDETEANTSMVASKQVEKIKRLSTLNGWQVLHIECTKYFSPKGERCNGKETVEKVILKCSADIVRRFLKEGVLHGKVVHENTEENNTPYFLFFALSVLFLLYIKLVVGL